MPVRFKKSDSQTVLVRAKEEVLRMLRRALPSKAELSPADFSYPPNAALGDLTFSCFSLAKVLRQSPAEVAAALRPQLVPRDGLIVKVETVGPYVNLFFDREKFGAAVARAIAKEGHDYGAAGAKRGRRVMIEFVSPNTNKPLHLGHVRNALLGEAVARLLEAAGSKVIRAALLNDRGVHIAKAMVAYKRWGGGATPSSQKEKGDHFVGRFYVLFEQKAREDKTLLDEAHRVLEKWEANDAAARALWKRLTDWAISGFKETEKLLGIKFDVIYRESAIYTKGRALIMRGLKRGLFKRDQSGAVVADLSSFALPEKVLLRSDGTSLYVTQDLYLAKKKFADKRLDRSIYCIGSEQNLYLQQLFAILKLLQFKHAGDLEHLSYGMVYLPEGKMKSREGLVVDADDLVGKLEQLVKEEIGRRHDFLDPGELERRAQVVALAALKFYILEISPQTDIHFHPEESISFTGRTGPYILYSYARLSSILRKVGASQARKMETGELNHPAEWALVVALARFPEIAAAAASTLDPSLVAKYAYALAKAVSDFYRDVPVLAAPAAERDSRLELVRNVRAVLKNALTLLGIETLEEM